MGQTWNRDLIHDAGNIGADVIGFFAGPHGDPGAIRRTASSIEALRDRFENDRRALNDAVDELRRTWSGSGAIQFSVMWHEGGERPAPAQVLAGTTAALDHRILGDPGAFDIIASDGRGIRYRTDGSSVGFLEPPR